MNNERIGKQLYNRKQGQKEYKAISYLSNRNQSDLYNSTNGRSSKDDHIKINCICNGMKEDGDDNALQFNSLASQGEFIGRKREQEKYITEKQNIIVKCFNCGKEGHLMKYCPLNQGTNNPQCIICKKNTHDKNNCPIRKCFKCDKIGHSAEECNRIALISKSVKCKRCKEYGHNENDCLINPIKIGNNDKRIQCLFCKSKEHLICPFPHDAYTIGDYNSDSVNITSSDNDHKANNKTLFIIPSIINSAIIEPEVIPNDFYSIISFFMHIIKQESVIANNHCNTYSNHYKKKMQLSPKKIFESISNDEIQYTIFCEKCGGMHTSFTCSKPKEATSYIQTKHHTFQVKNPLKFQAIKPRKEFIINHHLPYKNYYNDDNSSGDSFSEIVKDHLIKYPKNI